MTRATKPLSKRLRNAALVVVLLPLILPLAAAALVLALLHRVVLYLLIWLLWLPKGKDVLLVYSDSTVWRDYMTREIIPLVGERAILLNWSERRKWSPWMLSAHVFRTFGGRREFNPLVVLFRPLHRARVFRFWPAFKDWKNGYSRPLETLRDELALTLH